MTDVLSQVQHSIVFVASLLNCIATAEAGTPKVKRARADIHARVPLPLGCLLTRLRFLR
jgi:hypothetical protein